MALEEREIEQSVSEDLVKIFYIFSHEENTALKRNLDRHLRPRGEANVAHWDDREITPGDEWASEIKTHLNEADIILLLISSDFMASDSCWEKMKTALARHDKEEALVIPIVLRRVDLKKAPFNKLQMLPTNHKPISQWSDEDEACFRVKEGVDRSIDTIIKKREARRKIENANKLFLQHNYEKALFTYNEAFSSLPETRFHKHKVEVLQHIATTQRLLNQSKEALLTYEKALRLAPGDAQLHAQLHSNKGDVLFGKALFTDALDAYEKAIQHSSSDSLLHKKKGDTLLGLGHWPEAIAAYDMAIRWIADVREQSVAAQIHANQGEAFLQIDKLEKALVAFEKAIEYDAGNAELWRLKGKTYADLWERRAAKYSEKQALREIREIRNSYEKAIALKPDDAGLHCDYGEVLFRLRYYSGAKREYSRAIELESNCLFAYQGLASTLNALAQILDEKSRQLREQAQENENHFNQLNG